MVIPHSLNIIIIIYIGRIVSSPIYGIALFDEFEKDVIGVNEICHRSYLCDIFC